MSSTVTYFFQQYSAEITIIGGFFILISGLLGNVLNIIIFTSLKTFRETSCAFYLTAASFANLCHLLASLFSRILITGYSIDLTLNSLVLCRLRQFVAVIAPLMALSCMCFATIDQFTSLTIRWRKFSQRYIAWRLVMLTLVFWCLCNIPVIIFHNNNISPVTGKWVCSITNTNYAMYYTRFYICFLLGFLQLMIRIIFGLLAYINVRSLANRQTPIVRLERDKQITSMVLIEVVIDVILSLPFFIYYTYTSYITIDLAGLSFYTFIISITTIMSYATFAIGFYIYCSSSSRFRKQLVYVLVGIHLKYWCRIDIHKQNNQVVPQREMDKQAPSIIVTIDAKV